MVKIMVVDDDPDQISTVKYVLESTNDNYEVVGANDGTQCLQLLKDKKIPDLILLDIMMPVMNGWEVYNRLKENFSWKNIPVIFLTARTDRIAKNAGGFLGDDYIEKPFNREDLLKRIDKILRKK
ncbi:MAG: chemotaxis protein CheY [Thermoplasmatales archaeon SG8-52-3]|nr:MAG: chemotaxis protein CheY [Thermoplasmatales archaeon SG8-52-3]